MKYFSSILGALVTFTSHALDHGLLDPHSHTRICKPTNKEIIAEVLIIQVASHLLHKKPYINKFVFLIKKAAI